MNLQRITKPPDMGSSAVCPRCKVRHSTASELREANERGITLAGWATPEDLVAAYGEKYHYPANYAEQKRRAYGPYAYYCYSCSIWGSMENALDLIECLSCHSTYKITLSVLQRLAGDGCEDCFDRKEVRLL